jgi:hypothetical protein
MVEGVQVRSGYDVKIYYHSGDVERVNGVDQPTVTAHQILITREVEDLVLQWVGVWPAASVRKFEVLRAGTDELFLERFS